MASARPVLLNLFATAAPPLYAILAAPAVALNGNAAALPNSLAVPPMIPSSSACNSSSVICSINSSKAASSISITSIITDSDISIDSFFDNFLSPPYNSLAAPWPK